MITRASSFIHCAFDLEKEHVQGDVMQFGRTSVPPKNAKDPPTCIRLFSPKTSTRFHLYAVVFKIWMLFRDREQAFNTLATRLVVRFA